MWALVKFDTTCIRVYQFVMIMNLIWRHLCRIFSFCPRDLSWSSETEHTLGMWLLNFHITILVVLIMFSVGVAVSVNKPNNTIYNVKLKPWFFQASSFQLLKLEKFTAMIILHLQYTIYDLYASGMTTFRELFFFWKIFPYFINTL